MTTVNIHAAKTQLSKLVEKAEAGEEVIIARAGKPVVRLVAFASETLPPRRLGGLEGRFDVDFFEQPLPDDLLDLFEGR